MSTVILEQEFSPLDQLDLNESGFKIAVAVQGKLDDISRHDSRYVKWVAFLNYRTEEKDFKKQLPMHVCTKEDFDDFYGIVAGQEQLMEDTISDVNK